MQTVVAVLIAVSPIPKTQKRRSAFTNLEEYEAKNIMIRF
jgi:hypothetical protein